MLLDPSILGLHSAIATIVWKPSIAVIAEPFLSGIVAVIWKPCLTPFSPARITTSTHHAQSLPSFTVFTSSSYFALIKSFLSKKSAPELCFRAHYTHWFLVGCEILRHKRYEVKPFSPKRATFVSPLSKLILLLKRG